MDEVPVYTNNNYGNGFSKAVFVIGALWVGSLIAKNMINPSHEKQYHNDKRFMMKSANKINQQIKAKNMSTKLPTKVNIFNRNKRFNRNF